MFRINLTCAYSVTDHGVYLLDNSTVSWDKIFQIKSLKSFFLSMFLSAIIKNGVQLEAAAPGVISLLRLEQATCTMPPNL